MKAEALALKVVKMTTVLCVRRPPLLVRVGSTPLRREVEVKLHYGSEGALQEDEGKEI